MAAALLALVLAPASGAAASPAPPAERASSRALVVKEYQFKLTWLAKFTKFVSWPDGCMSEADGAFRIGIVGHPRGAADLFPAELWGIEQELAGRPLQVVRIPELADADERRTAQLRSLRSCHVVFVCWSERRRFDELLPQLAGSCALTVSDVSGFAEDGGMLTLTLPRPRHRSGWSFAANLDAARAAGLSIRPRVLKLRGCRIVAGRVYEAGASQPRERVAGGESER